MRKENETQELMKNKDYIKKLMNEAKHGLVASQYELAMCYEDGEGVKQNKEKTLYWLTRAAKQGDLSSKICLSTRYRGAFGYDVNHKKEAYWLLRTARFGDEDSQYNIAVYYEEAKEEKKALFWYSCVAKQGDVIAQYVIDTYQNEKRFPSEYERNIRILLPCAEAFEVEEQFEVAYCYEKEQDYVNAVYWYTQAANQNYSGAELALGRCYENGLGVDRDYMKALSFYKLSYEHGSDEAKEYITNLKQKEG